jgi:membrane protein implicated in regulation of membrane protease activity
MAESSIWWIIAGTAVAFELVLGTFYLLMLALGTGSAALAAHAGAGAIVQMVTAAVIGGGAVVGWHLKQASSRRELPAQANPNVNLDIGEPVQVTHWNPDGTADVHYRGARWTAIHRSGVSPSAGSHRVAELVGNRLLVDKA